ncbi:MAG: hypothetical protein JXR95_10685 [Deltaproteobacteria bacterium]|nr:hypothetical protein [Deltaproteobacteria bacterium]
MYYIYFIISFVTALNSTTYSERLNAAYKNNEISLRERIDFAENALKNPKLLPDKWKNILYSNPVMPWEGTSLLVEAFQLRMLNNLKADYTMPAELEFHLDSGNYPIRVYYSNASQEQLAQSVLLAADYSWQVEIEEFGFYAPPIVTPEGRYRIYIADTGMGGGGYTAPISDYPDTLRDDCVTYIYIDPSNDPMTSEGVVAHELNHSMQASMDCIETTAFWENTATYMMLAVYPDTSYYVGYFAEPFQGNPWMSLSDGGQNDYYWYGGYLWPLWLSEHYTGDFQDATLIRKIWEDSIQESNFSNNSPNYMEAIDSNLQADHNETLVDAFRKFNVARYFTGYNYISGKTDLPFAEDAYYYPEYTSVIYLDETFSKTPTTTLPKKFGVNYYLIGNPGNYSRETVIRLTPARNPEEWSMQLVSKETGVENLYSSPADDAHIIILNPSDTGEAVLIVERNGGTDFDPDSIGSSSSYTLDVYPEIPPPEITMIMPQSAFNESTETVSVFGENFDENTVLTFSPGTGISVENCTLEGTTRINCTLIMDETALGPQDVVISTVLDEVTLEDGFTVMENTETDSSSSGCSCSSTTSGPLKNNIIMMPLLMLMAFILRRRL